MTPMRLFLNSAPSRTLYVVKKILRADVPTVLSFPCCPLMVLSSWLTYTGHPFLAVLSRNSCPVCPFLAVLIQLS
jgi:hypothetical protein